MAGDPGEGLALPQGTWIISGTFIRLSEQLQIVAQDLSPSILFGILSRAPA